MRFCATSPNTREVTVHSHRKRGELFAREDYMQSQWRDANCREFAPEVGERREWRDSRDKKEANPRLWRGENAKFAPRKREIRGIRVFAQVQKIELERNFASITELGPEGWAPATRQTAAESWAGGEERAGERGERILLQQQLIPGEITTENHQKPHSLYPQPFISGRSCFLNFCGLKTWINYDFRVSTHWSNRSHAPFSSFHP